MNSPIAGGGVLALGVTLFGCASVAPRDVRRSSPPPDSANAPIARTPPMTRASQGGAGAPTAASDAEALAKQLANPIASLISVPLQLNHDDDIGPGDGQRWTLNVQPVIPISLGDDWNLISRTILPVIDQQDIPAGNDETGIGDILQSLFLSPVAPTDGGWILGVGPVFLVPSASDETLGGEKWGAGPTGVALRQDGPWTYGALANHVWSFAGDDNRDSVNTTFLQPFVSYTTPTAYTFGLNAESTYDWQQDELAVPINGTLSKVLKLGVQLVSIGGGLRYWVEDSPASPEGLGFRLFVTLLFPK